MPRRKKSSFLESLLEDTAAVPWPVGLIIALVVYLGLRYWIPGQLADNVLLHGLGDLSAGFAPLIALLFVAAAGVSAWRTRGSRQLLERNRNLADIRALSWREFERLIAEAFREQGYSVVENDGKGAGGGIDVRLRRGGQTTLVQCKHYQRSRVGVAVIREMFGVQISEGFDACTVVTTGTFTRDAKDFADKNGIRLYDGPDLMKLTGGVTIPLTLVPVEDDITTESVSVDRSTSPSCPTCGSGMTLRTARKGAHAGSQFYGCSTYPRCRGTRSA